MDTGAVLASSTAPDGCVTTGLPPYRPASFAVRLACSMPSVCELTCTLEDHTPDSGPVPVL